jgi:hypothetical protein
MDDLPVTVDPAHDAGRRRRHLVIDGRTACGSARSGSNGARRAGDRPTRSTDGGRAEPCVDDRPTPVVDVAPGGDHHHLEGSCRSQDAADLPDQDALDAIAGNGKSALGIIEGSKGDVTGPLLDAATVLEAAGWTTDAQLVALVGSSTVVATIAEAAAGVQDASGQTAVDRAIAELTAGDSSASPVDALGHYGSAVQELKKYV